VRFVGALGLVVSAALGAPLYSGALAARLAIGPPPRPAADCQPFAGRACLFPFPDNLYTRPDRSTPTGLRVRLPAEAMPVNGASQRIAVGEYDRNDGFSPGSTVILHVPGLESEAALRRTGAVSLADISRSFTRSQPIVMIDERSGARQPIWAELDATADSGAARDLLIHPARALLDGHTYIVALRDLREAGGRRLEAPDWFERLRDGRPLPPVERSQRRRYARILGALARAEITRSGLYEAWDFTVESERGLTAPLLAIRDRAFAELGDGNLADGRVRGRPPRFEVTSDVQIGPQLRRVEGSFQVPCFLVRCGATATAGFHYSSPAADATPTQIPGNVATAPFECIVPSSATPATPARISLYGHGFLSSHAEVEVGDVQEMAVGHNMVFCATDWWGLAQADAAHLVQALHNPAALPDVIDRVQQGVLNTLYLGRLMDDPAGLAASPAFETGGRPLIDTSNLFYDGNSDGGILGGIVTAVSPDVRRAVLGVTGIDFFNLMVPRGHAFSAFGGFALHNYPDQSIHPLVLDLLQQLWDRADPDGYAQHMTAAPLPDTPAHTVLMQIAYGDFEVSMYAAAVEARTVGAAGYQPALELNDNRARDRNLLFGIPALPREPFGGSALVVWDSGPGRTEPPPLADLAPEPSATNHDPHEDPRYTPAAQLQKSEFLSAQGAVTDVCGAAPCRSSRYVP
jgi:hypothetical protein